MPNKAQDDDLVMNLVELALARPPDEREAYLQSACGDDSELLDQVWTLRAVGRAHERVPAGSALFPRLPRASFRARRAAGWTASASCARWLREAWASYTKPWTKNWNVASP